MATVAIELRKTKRKDGKQPLVLRITAFGRVARRNTGLHILAEQWNAAQQRVNSKHHEAMRLNDALNALRREAEGLNADAIAERRPAAASDIAQKVFATHDFFELAAQRGKDFKKDDQYGTGRSYSTLIARVKGFRSTLKLEEITPEFIEAFRKHLKKEGYAHNTIVWTLGRLRTVWNAAGMKGDSPFEKATVGTYRAAEVEELTKEEITMIRNYIPAGKWEKAAKDTWLFSYYAAGMSSIDVLQLTWPDIRNGRIFFGRHKVSDTTGAKLNTPLNDYSKEILARQDKGGVTVFGLVNDFGRGEKATKERERVQQEIAKALKTHLPTVGGRSGFQL